MSKKIITTFDKWMKDPKIKKSFNEGYKEFVLAELILAMTKDDKKSVRVLAKEVRLSLTVIQNICSGKQKDIKIKKMENI